MQLADRMPSLTGLGEAGRQRMQAGTEAGIQQREAAYQAAPSTREHPIASGIGRFGGEMAATAPLGMLAGGARAAGPLASRMLGTAQRSILPGAAAGATQPVVDPGSNFALQKIGQAKLGAAGGAVGGALSEAVGSTLARAIGSNNPAAVDAALMPMYKRAVRPRPGDQQSGPALDVQDRRILTAVDSIIAEKPNLKLTNASGISVTGQLPKTLREFTEAIDQSKKTLFRAYDDMAKKAGQQGAMVDLAPAVNNLRQVAQSPFIEDFYPAIGKDALQLADNLNRRGAYGVEEAQDAAQALTKTLNAFFHNPTHETVTHAALLAPVVKVLRDGIDQAVTSLQGPGYQALRIQYGALRSIERDMAAAAQREANKHPGGLAGAFADIAASEQALHGIFALDPSRIGTAGLIKGAQAAHRYINSPNRAISRMFERRERSLNPPGRRSYLAVGAGAEAGERGNDLYAAKRRGDLGAVQRMLQQPVDPAAFLP
jgi:hypothetical protein